MRRLAPLLAVLALSAAPATAGAECADADLVPTAASLERVEAATFCLHNEERAQAGLSALLWSDQLAQSADLHSLDMVARLFFEHDNPDGETPRDRIEATGYGPDWTGENIFYGYGSGFTARDAVEAWMNSPGHRANILRPEFEHLGLGVAFGVPEPLSFLASGAVYTANFGSRAAPDDETIRSPPGAPGADEADGKETGGEETGAQETDAQETGAQEGAEQTGKEAKGKKKLRKCLKKARKAKRKQKRKRCKRRWG